MAERIHGFCTHTIQAHAFLKALLSYLAPVLILLTTSTTLPRGNATAVIAHRNRFAFDGEFYLLCHNPWYIRRCSYRSLPLINT
jgi:hypothetical protein